MKKFWKSELMRIVFISAIAGVGIVTLAYGVWYGTRAFVFDYFKIPTESMSPTLQPGDEVVVNKLRMGARIYKNFHFEKYGQELESWRTKGYKPVNYNDIVVFNFPQHNGKINFVINDVYCKRVVALPGDTLSIVNGYYRNNNHDGILGREDAQSKLYSTPDSTINWDVFWTMPYMSGWNIRNFGPMYIPRKGDLIKISVNEVRLYNQIIAWETGKDITFDWDTGEMWADGEPLKWHRFKHNFYFMAGDNVFDSYDSRNWGLVPEEYIVGVVEWVFRKVDGRWTRVETEE